MNIFNALFGIVVKSKYILVGQRHYSEDLLLVHQPSSFPERSFSRPLLHRFILAVFSVANVLRAHGWRHFLRPNLVCLAGAEPR